ncbi:hypothetical protein [Chondromyces crocatus]|uniref:Lipoprotein n=1 Tax=Chondromyces crocatus TaxID=52 RepID=A0A0K1E732_CHOCO|nr:hypothetical protein [Chondromyces crocatus]AKT36654.1 uncharacterized protein CMC5_007740 [Chondromyces crocatus]
MSHWRGVLAAVTLGVLAGCSDPNEVMLVVQTDLSMPKDIDTIAIEVYKGGSNEARFLRAFPGLGDENAIARLPLTLGLYADEPGTPIRVVAYARRNGELGEVRIYREVVTTLPEGRAAALHVPLQYLCEGSGTQSGTSAVDALCPSGQTCVAGICQSSTVDSAELPDYAPEAIFGGGDGESGGACFDVEACLSGASEAVVDTSDCTVEVEGDVNVALRTAPTGAGTDGKGFCVDVGCVVALDEGVATGYALQEGKVQLPQGVCAKYRQDGVPGRVDAVMTAPVRDGCPKKHIGLPTCGPWSAAGR